MPTEVRRPVTVPDIVEVRRRVLLCEVGQEQHQLLMRLQHILWSTFSTQGPTSVGVVDPLALEGVRSNLCPRRTGILFNLVHARLPFRSILVQPI